MKFDILKETQVLIIVMIRRMSDTKNKRKMTERKF
jgi:hypothetical protein